MKKIVINKIFLLIPPLLWLVVLILLRFNDDLIFHELAFLSGILTLITLIFISIYFPFKSEFIKTSLSIFSYLIMICDVVSILLIVFSDLVIVHRDSLTFGTLDIPFHILLIINVVCITLNFFNGYMKSLNEREKYKYIIFSIIIAIPILLVFNLLLPIVGVTNFTVFTGLIPAIFVILIIYISENVKIYTFNFFLFKTFPYIFSFIFTLIYLTIVIHLNIISVSTLIFSPFLSILFLQLGYILKSKLFFNDNDSDKNISLALNEFVKNNNKEELIKIFKSALNKILNSKVIDFVDNNDEKYKVFLNKVEIINNQNFAITFNEKEAVIIFLDFGIFFIESASINMIKFKEKYNQVNNLSTGLVLAINRIRIINKLEEINSNFEKELKERTQTLENSYDELQELEKAKDEFVALTSHQLKTPLTVIKGYTDMLSNEFFGKLSNTQLGILNKIQLQTKNLLQISENILNVFKIKSGKFIFKNEYFNLNELLKEIYEVYLDKAKNKNIKFTYVNTSIVQKWINGDRYKLKQAFSNIVDNAINYTERGYVKIELEEKKLIITDSGIGIPEHFKDKLYNQFERADNARNIKPDGTGIGLYLTKKILEESNMKIQIDSNNKGTKVTITLKD